MGGSRNGPIYLGDSNIDWGQDLNLLADYIDMNDVDPLYVSYFGASDPTYYGIDKPRLFEEDGTPIDFAPANPAPGRYAISVNHLHAATVDSPDLFDSFRNLEPIGRLGYSIYIYEIPESKEGSWVAHCIDPEQLADEELAEMLIGKETVRHVFFGLPEQLGISRWR